MTAGRILLVEDDPLSLKLMRDVLQASGYETGEESNGLDALDRVASFIPQLIVIDIGLPGLDGVETTRRLKSSPETAAIPVVAVTAYARPVDEQRMRDAGCDAHLVKPLRFAQFVDVVRSLMPSSARPA
jgi:two-component system, cell cycle response regulator DivK